MIIIDAQLSPHLAKWTQEKLGLEAFSVRKLGLRDSSDLDIYKFAKSKKAIVMTKDEDFVNLQSRLGSPPKIIWITCGNTSNERLKELLSKKLKSVMQLLEHNNLVEISD